MAFEWHDKKKPREFTEYVDWSKTKVVEGTYERKERVEDTTFPNWNYYVRHDDGHLMVFWGTSEINDFFKDKEYGKYVHIEYEGDVRIGNNVIQKSFKCGTWKNGSSRPSRKQ